MRQRILALVPLLFLGCKNELTGVGKDHGSDADTDTDTDADTDTDTDADTDTDTETDTDTDTGETDTDVDRGPVQFILTVKIDVAFATDSDNVQTFLVFDWSEALSRWVTLAEEAVYTPTGLGPFSYDASNEDDWTDFINRLEDDTDETMAVRSVGLDDSTKRLADYMESDLGMGPGTFDGWDIGEVRVEFTTWTQWPDGGTDGIDYELHFYGWPER